MPKKKTAQQAKFAAAARKASAAYKRGEHRTFQAAMKAQLK